MSASPNDSLQLSERPLDKKLVSELLDIAKAMNIDTAKFRILKAIKVHIQTHPGLADDPHLLPHNSPKRYILNPISRSPARHTTHLCSRNLSMYKHTQARSCSEENTRMLWGSLQVNSDGFRAELRTACAVGRVQSISIEVRCGLTNSSGSQWREGSKKSSDIWRKPVGGIEIPVSATGSQWKRGARQWQLPSANAVQCRWAGCYLRVYY
ncbi:hypothetical protein B0H14DRAFT_2605948 [Mycena olivaceomarginata]|nr:hypothetical protein B0H14DRAFT_2605948 [Mycena olivaceomarginata]